MVVSFGLLCLSQWWLHVLGLDRRHDLWNPRKAVHAVALLLAIEQHRPSPLLEHRAPSCTLDVPLAVPDQREQALDRVGRQQRLAQQRRHLQPMHRQHLLERLPERVRCRLVLGPQPGIGLDQPAIGPVAGQTPGPMKHRQRAIRVLVNAVVQKYIFIQWFFIERTTSYSFKRTTGGITYSWNGCGKASNTRRCICTPTRQLGLRSRTWRAI